MGQLVNYDDTSFRVKARHVIKEPKWETMLHNEHAHNFIQETKLSTRS